MERMTGRKKLQTKQPDDHDAAVPDLWGPSVAPPIPITMPSGPAMRIVPSYEGADAAQLSQEDVEIITQNKVQISDACWDRWEYHMRREAQAIVDFLWLGPLAVAKDLDFLRENRITMLLAVRDNRQAQARLMSAVETARQLGIAADHIDVADNQALIQAFPTAVSKINEHLLHVYRSQALAGPPGGVEVAEGSHIQDRPGATDPGQIAIDPARFQRGRVLIFCETGNDRSAALAAAYIMTVFGTTTRFTVQFIGHQRFCTNFDEETNNWLRSYEDILAARRQVAKFNREMAAHNAATASATSSAGCSAPGGSDARILGGKSKPKRTLSETYDEDMMDTAI